jgi:hypothetical protein
MSKMFGLMRMRSCGVDRQERRRHRLHYCGVCKTIGRDYGAGARLALNHDIVLIAELMSALSGQTVPDSITPGNCLRLPEDSPEFLRYAAAANVLLAGAKLDDHAADSGLFHWRLLARWLHPRYLKARRALAGWGVDVAQVESLLGSQAGREQTPVSLEHVAEPTAFATGALLGQAAVVAGVPEQRPFLERFGRRFGTLVYLLDAWEDFARDLRRGEFNALAALCGGREPARGQIVDLAEQVQRDFESLPVGAAFRELLVLRFRSSLRLRFADLFVTAPALVVVSMAGAPGTATYMAHGKGGLLGGLRAWLEGTPCQGCFDKCCNCCSCCGSEACDCDCCCDGCDCDC